MADISSDISAYQHKFRAVGNNTKQENTSKVRKRNRAVISCLQCRSKKSRCDREQPCGTCKAHGTTCTYTKPTNTKSTSKATPQDRLNHLEKLLLDMMQTKDNPQQTQLPVGRSPSQLASPEDSIASNDNADNPPDQSELPQGSYRTTETEESYVGPTHWQAILETIHGLKSELNHKEGPSHFWGLPAQYQKQTLQSQSLFSTARPPDLAYILRAIPERSVSDRLLAFYFNSKYFSVPIVHLEHFQKMYERFWNSPQEMPILWISQVFSMLSVSTTLSEIMNRSNSKGQSMPDEVSAARNKYSTASAQCLVLADYTKPQRHLIEALFLYCQAKGIATMDPAGETWLLYAIMIRQALRLGYHRDPKHFPHMSVFDGEMRRRAWFLIYQFDILTAFQLGLPCNLQVDDEWDTELPRSLNDSDFDEFSTELPPSRSDKDPTTILYFIAKASIMNVQKKLLNQQFTSKQLSYEDDILRLDAELKEVRAQLPAVLKLKPMSQSFADPAFLIMFRFQCDVIYLKTTCILHRRFITATPRQQYSIDRCTQSSMEILRHQIVIYNESKPGCMLHQDQWFLKSLHLSNCLLAAVILCQVYVSTSERECSPSMRDEILGLLRTTLEITKEHKVESDEADRFNNALEHILRKIDPQRNVMVPQVQNANGVITSSGLVSPAETGSSTIDPSLGGIDFQILFKDPENIDWNMIDHGFGPPPPALNDIEWPEIDMNYLNGDVNSFLQQPVGSVG